MDQDDRENLHVRMPSALKRKFAAYAAANGWQIQELVQGLVERELKTKSFEKELAKQE